jgi:glutamate racemase
LPQENFLYLGDVARLPYGTKSASVITRYASHCVRYLLEEGAKVIVIACNTATATALPVLRGEFSIPIYGVIEPGVKSALSRTRSGKILVLATPSTVKSEAYTSEFLRRSSDVRVEQISCPLFVPLAEEGWFRHPVTESVIRTYLSQTKDPEYDTVVLGCTHYPLLAPSIAEVLPRGVSMVHGGPLLAEQVKKDLGEQRLLRTNSARGSIRFVATDRISPTTPLVRALFGDRCEMSLIDL